ncbi:MAG: aspartate aminotransferase family protein [Bacteroidetes Order II. Incertae sedis bacterium]|nr:aspartate aminotransferase family protein [Bacteroidetes Order II. bacterium]
MHMTSADWMELEESTQLKTYNKWPVPLVKAQGAWVEDVEGNRFLDLYGGHCVAFLGHNHPNVVAAIKDQADKILFYSNAVYAPVRARASKLLSDLAPEGMDRVFFVNSGAEANEAAMKMARKATDRTDIVSVEGDFHGRTLGALATTWQAKYRQGYEGSFAPVHFVPFGDAEATCKVILDVKPAAVIIEPIQSMQGMRTAPKSYFQALSAACKEAGSLLIMDEVQTGIGRTGQFTYSDVLGIEADMITLAKSLGGGVPVSAVLIRNAVADTVKFGDQGTTFGGGMLAMAAVEAVLQTVVDEDLSAKALSIFDQMVVGCDARGICYQGAGCLIGIHFGQPVAPIVVGLRKRGILVGGSADPQIMRLMPPAVVSAEEIDLFFTHLDDVLEEVKA